MNLAVPRLHLSHGQLVWTLCLGQFPLPPQQRHLVAQLRYLRQVDIPFREATRGRGRGNPLTYSYEEAVDVAVALKALRRNVQPHLVRTFLLNNRPVLRPLYRQALEEQPVGALETDWVKSRGSIIAVLEQEYFLRLHNRYSETPGRVELVPPGAAHRFEHVFSLQEHMADGTTVVNIPLTRLILDLVYWARRVPPIRAGRKAQQAPTPLT
jgi:hypothetical protein